MDILNYIDKMQEMYEGKPSSMAQEPRNMNQGGRIPFAEAKSVQKKYQPSGEDLTEAQIEGYAKRFNAAKAAKETNFKNLVNKIFDTEDFENFKAKPTESQLRSAKKAGKFRAGTGIIPAQYIKEFNQAITAGVDSPEFKNLLRITGRTEEEILKLNESRPGGKVPIKVRADAAAKSFPEDRKVSEEEKLESQKKTKATRAEKETVGKKYASEAELKRFNLINEQKKKLNKFFQENPKALLNTEFGKKIKKLMDVRINKNGNFFQNTRPNDYYIAKAKEGKIFDIFDINKIAKGQRSTKFTSNLNILPGQFNQAFIEGQVNKYFKKGGRLEGQTEILENISKYLDNIGVKVDIEDVGRIGGGEPVFFNSKTNRYPHIENTLKKMNIPDELLTEIKPDGTLKKLNKFLTSKHQQLIKNQFCPGNKKGGVPGSCDIGEAMDNMLKQTNAVKQGAIKGTEATRIANKASKVVRFGTGKGLGAVLGPIGLAGEAVFEVAMAVPGYARGESGKRLLGDSILGLIPGVGQSAEEEFAEYATKDGMSQLDQQKIKNVNRFLQLNESLPIAYKNIGKGGRGDPLRGAKNFERLYNEYSPLYDQFVGGPPSESASTAFAEQQRINDLINADKAIRAEQRNIAGEEDFMAASGGRAGLSGGDTSGRPPESGPMSQGLRSLYKNGRKL